MGLFTRSLRPLHEDTPNANDPPPPPGTVAPHPLVEPGDPNGVVFEGFGGGWPPLHASPWSGWPGEWVTPNWWHWHDLVDAAWSCLDLNSSVFAAMPPYLVDAAESLPADWLTNPDPMFYRSWAEFARDLMWDFQMGEVFVLATSYYANGFPARFHVVPPWTVNVEIDYSRPGYSRRYRIGELDVSGDMLHIPYRSTVADTRGTGPLDAGRSRMVAAGILLRYATNFVQGGAVPSGVLESDEELTASQTTDLKNQWIEARMSSLGLPAVLSGGVTWKATQTDPISSALVELAKFNESRIAVLLGVPPFLQGLPSGGDSMTYSNVSAIFDYHWRAGLKPKVQRLMMALTNWLTPRGTGLEVNRDEYVRPGPLERAQTQEIYIRNNVLSENEVREMERFSTTVTAPGDQMGVLK